MFKSLVNFMCKKITNKSLIKNIKLLHLGCIGLETYNLFQSGKDTSRCPHVGTDTENCKIYKIFIVTSG